MPQDRCCRPPPDFDVMFNDDVVRRDLAEYRHKGVRGHTKRLIDAIRAEGDLAGADLLDIGGGVGAVAHELMAAGAHHVTGIDLSRNYLRAAEDEARDRGYLDRATFRYGDFVQLSAADDVPTADVVTLDRVLCCYPDWRALVGASTSRARRLYGLVYPVDRPWWRAAAAVGNVVLRIMRADFRFHIHPERAVDRMIRDAGFTRRYRRTGFVWQTVLYRRVGSPTTHA